MKNRTASFSRTSFSSTLCEGNEDTAQLLRNYADKMQNGEMEGFAMAAMVNGEYEFIKFASLVDAITLSSLLHQNCLEAFRR